MNFETIINVIEELIVYYSKHGLIKKSSALMKPFFNAALENKILNFSIIENTASRYKLKIPGIEDKLAKEGSISETPEQFYLQQLLSHILTDISTEIEHYAYHTDTKSNVIKQENIKINSLFQNWIYKINNKDILRMYTLNYDRNFKIILENSPDFKYNIFEGFECNDIVGYNEEIKPNIKRILSDYDSNTHYNLHGSVFWRVKALNHNSLELPEFRLASFAYLEVNTNRFPTSQIEKGKTVFLTNLITGYQKAQKSIFSPFRQMQASFDRDCIFCDKLFIIGYSFGDEHINSIIRTALQENHNLQIEIVDPSFKNDDFDLMVMLKIFGASSQQANIPSNLSKNVHGFLNGSVIVHAKTFKEYMQDFV